MSNEICLLLILGIRIKAEIFLFGWIFLGLAWSNHYRYQIIKDNFESISNGIGDKIKEGKCCLFDLGLPLILKQEINLFHHAHDVSLVE